MYFWHGIKDPVRRVSEIPAKLRKPPKILREGFEKDGVGNFREIVTSVAQKLVELGLGLYEGGTTDLSSFISRIVSEIHSKLPETEKRKLQRRKSTVWPILVKL